MKMLVIGHGGHGKDTAAAILAYLYDTTFISSSWAAAEKAVYPHMPEYSSVEECYADRRNRRVEWRDLISDYNTPDPSKLCRDILAEHDIYVGMRSDREYQSSKHLFDKIVWVDASERIGPDESMGIEYDPDTMIRIDNNGSESDLLREIGKVIG